MQLLLVTDKGVIDLFFNLFLRRVLARESLFSIRDIDCSLIFNFLEF